MSITKKINAQKKSSALDLEKISASYRDPSGFVFKKNHKVLRQINQSYQPDYDLLISSGLYDKLVSLNLLIPHKEVSLDLRQTPNAFKIIEPVQIPFISYPYEWTFSMLKDAALVTLEIQKIALEYGMTLKDASSFNIQFIDGTPKLIDTLSFEIYKVGKPWIAYKQFVEHFLTPLLIAKYNDIRLNRIFTVFLDGVPVDLVTKLLPFRTRLSPSLLIHIYAHAASQKRHSKTSISKEQKGRTFDKRAFLGLLDNLEGTIKKLNWIPEKTEWGDYYDPANNNYNDQTFSSKAKIIKDFLKFTKPKTVWDMGANTGYFSRLVSPETRVISSDNDYGALEKNYQTVVTQNETNILPIFLDLVTPTPSTGWANVERPGIFERGKADVIFSLALIHHLAISHNIPFEYIAELFSKLGKFLVIEFVPKEDSQVKILLTNRKDIFPNYNKSGFEDAFLKFYTIKRRVSIPKSKRTLYLLQKR